MWGWWRYFGLGILWILLIQIARSWALSGRPHKCEARSFGCCAWSVCMGSGSRWRMKKIQGRLLLLWPLRKIFLLRLSFQANPQGWISQSSRCLPHLTMIWVCQCLPASVDFQRKHFHSLGSKYLLLPFRGICSKLWCLTVKLRRRDGLLRSNELSRFWWVRSPVFCRWLPEWRFSWTVGDRCLHKVG